ncbi:MAG: Ig-like domain-containing protein [Clostridia bacterium]|nr:Ig-like domain-containing protein [Clostridia bacterium]
MKRTLTSVIALMLTLLMLVPQTIFSVTAANPTISASNVEANPGDTVDVTVNIANNPGVTSVLLTIGFDSSALTLTGVTDGGILGSAFHSNNYKNPYTLSWANDTATTNITNNGTAVTLKFKVADNATVKKYSITVSYDVDNYEVIDKDMNPISFGLVNGSIDVKAAACKHTNTTKVAAKASTCLVQGNNAYTRCNDCGEVISGSDAKLPLGNCSFSAWTTTTPATCTAAGKQTRTCSVCKKSETKDIAALGHNYSTSYTIDVAASCDKAGEKSQHCSRCSERQNITAIPATGHSYTSKVTTPATCEKAGVKTFTCSKCSKSYTEAIAALGHNYSTSYTIDVAATCEKAGSKSQHCTKCDSKQNVTAIPATGHSYTSKVTTPATCEKAGVKTFTCSKCSKSYTEAIPALGHNYTSKVTTAATCEKVGVKTFTCSRCSKSYTEAIAASGHNYSTSYTIDVAATCEKAGSKSQHCTKCDSKINVTVIPATGHSYTSKVTTPATHTSTGVMTYTCACGKSYTEVIDKITAHSHSAVVTAPTCTEQGYTTYTCSCGDSYIADYTPAKGHTEGKWVVTTPATSTQTGIKTMSCSVCGVELKTEIIPVVIGKVHSVSVSDVTLYYKDSATITPSIKVDSGVKYSVRYSSSSPSVASVDANGNISTGDRGEATITVTVTDEYGNTVKDTCKVKVEYKWWQWIIVIVLFGWIWY